MNHAGAQWTRVKEIFAAATECDVAEREAVIARLCDGDLAIESEVRRLLSLSDSAGSFLEQPAVTSSELTDSIDLPAGLLLAGRYRITELIGRGGMGEVYEAVDELVAERVAVKVVRPAAEPTDKAASRWRRELQLARKVSHSGVCRVHDIGVHQHGGLDLVFLTMERLTGESLHDRLVERNLTGDEAIAIAQQVAAALDASHQQGVLHRDIKPRNIMVERRPNGAVRAVLTDFGLARDVREPDAGVTKTGWIAGTAGYMAPELLRGEQPSIASDLYAFGVVVRELLLATTPANASSATDVFGRALHADPGARFESASAFVSALEEALYPAKRPTKVMWSRIAAAVVVVALAGIAFRFYWQSGAAIPTASQLLLTEMVNGTTETELVGASEMLRTQLAQSPHFELVDETRQRGAAKQMGRAPESIGEPEVAREIALREGAPLVVYSALTRVGSDYLLNISLERVGPRPALTRGRWSESFTAASRVAVPDAVHRAASWIRTTVGETQASIDEQDRMPADTTSSSFEALRLFKQASDESRNGQLQTAVALLYQAIRLDPEFASAHMRLADNLIKLRQDKEGYAAWQHAIELAERKTMTSRETLRIRTQYLDDTGEVAEAEKAYRAFAQHYPDDFLATLLHGNALRELDRTEEAIPLLERAHALRPGSETAAVYLAMAYLNVGRPSEAARIVTALDAAGHRDWATWLRALPLFMDGDLPSALAALEPLNTTPDPNWRSRAVTIRSSWLAEGGDDEGALRELASGIAFDKKMGLRERLADKYLHVAEIEARLGRPGASANALQAIESVDSANRIARAGSVLVRVGDVAAARKLLRAFDDRAQVRSNVAARYRLEAELELARGAPAAAVQLFERGFDGIRRSESRWPMVRALIAAGDIDGAIRLLTRIVDNPVVIYSRPEPHAPGLRRQAALMLVQLVARRDPQAASALQKKYAAFVTDVRSVNPSTVRSRVP